MCGRSGAQASTVAYSLFYAFKDKDPDDVTAIRAGETAVLKSHTTGLFCQLADVPGTGGNGEVVQGLKCSEPSQGQSTVVDFTGTRCGTSA